jgi:hypothetical protein
MRTPSRHNDEANDRAMAKRNGEPCPRRATYSPLTRSKCDVPDGRVSSTNWLDPNGGIDFSARGDEVRQPNSRFRDPPTPSPIADGDESVELILLRRSTKRTIAAPNPVPVVVLCSTSQLRW